MNFNMECKHGLENREELLNEPCLVTSSTMESSKTHRKVNYGTSNSVISHPESPDASIIRLVIHFKVSTCGEKSTSVPEALLLTLFPDLSQLISVDMMITHRTLESTQLPVTSRIKRLIIANTM